MTKFEMMRGLVWVFESSARRTNPAERVREAYYLELDPGIARWIRSLLGYVFPGCHMGSPVIETPITCLFDVDVPSVILYPMERKGYDRGTKGTHDFVTVK